jgi:hypothetical protein
MGNTVSAPTTQVSLKQILYVEIIVKYVKHFINSNTLCVRHVTGNDQDYLRKIPRVVVQKSALL